MTRFAKNAIYLGARTGAIGLLLVVLPVLYLVETVWRIRIGHLPSDRIGHLAGNPYKFIARRRRGGAPARTTEIFVVGRTCNAAIGQVVTRYLSPHVTLLHGEGWGRLYFLVRPLLRRTRFHVEMEWGTYEYLILDQADYHFDLTEEETARGSSLLEKMGIGPSDWFVCFHSRSQQYLNDSFGSQSDRHDYRDANIETYLEAMEFITERGGFAIRMGTETGQPLSRRDNPRIIDYATRFRSDFGDVYLCAKCRFFLGTGSGLIILPLVFGRPYAAANMVPLSQPMWTRDALYVPKLFGDSATGRPVHFARLRALGLFEPEGRRFFSTSHYTDAGLVPIASSAQDVLGLCREMYERTVENASVPPRTALQSKYREFLRDIPEAECTGDIAASFAERHRELIA